MELMVVKDVDCFQPGLVMLTGALLVSGIHQRSRVKELFGECVEVRGGRGCVECFGVKDFAMSVSMEGAIQVTLIVESSASGDLLKVGAIVSSID